MGIPARTCAAALVAALGTPGLARAQETPRPQDSPIPDLVAGLSYISLSEEVTSASYRVESDSPLAADTRFWTLKVPWQTDVDLGSDWGTLYLEAAAGLLQAEDQLRVDTGEGLAVASQDWRAYGGLVGAGWSFPLPDGWRLRPSASLALTRIENDARYNELGEQVLAPLIDGTYVNWDAWAATSLLSLALLQDLQLGPVGVHLSGRYSFAYTDVFHASSEFQEQADWSRFLAVRLDLDGPTPLRLGQRNVDWGCFLGYAGFYDIRADALGFDQIYETGASLESPTLAGLPDLQLSGAWIFGPGLSGWSLGLGISL